MAGEEQAPDKCGANEDRPVRVRAGRNQAGAKVGGRRQRLRVGETDG